MPLPMPRVSRTLAIVAMFAAPPLGAQHAEHSVPGAQPVPATAAAPSTIGDSAILLYREALGPFTRNAGSASRDAQSYFDQGMQLMYSFAQPEAVRSFRESQRRDSACAACYWGEAWSRGAYLNVRMDSAGGAAAYAAAQNALRFSAKTSRPVDRALIAAMAVRYEPVFQRTRRVEPFQAIYRADSSGTRRCAHA